jgi:glycosyltransferase involved in cell wall biosynthesis
LEISVLKELFRRLNPDYLCKMNHPESENRSKLHILFLARWYPNRYDPMFGLFVRRHAEAVSLKHKVSVVYVTESDSVQKKFEIVQENHQGVNEVIVYYRKSLTGLKLFGKIINFYRFFRANLQAIAVVKSTSGDFQITHIHVLTRLGLIALYYKIFYKRPYLITEHWSRYLPLTNGFHGFLRKSFTRLIVRNASAITTVTQNLADAMQAHGLENRNYVILPNVVDTERFTILTNKMIPKVKMIHLSCFEDRSKNISGIIETIRLLHKQRNDFECFMVGDGMDFQSLKDSALDLVQHGIMRFTGLLEGEALSDMLKSADFLILFSNYENMPVVILEAFACGLPVVSSRVGGIPEMVNDSNGLLVDAGNQSQFAEAISTMIDNYQNYNAVRIRNQVESVYGYEAVSSFLDQLYRKSLRD